MARPKLHPSKRRQRIDVRLPIPPKSEWYKLLKAHGFDGPTEFFEWTTKLLLEGGPERILDEILRLKIRAAEAKQEAARTASETNGNANSQPASKEGSGLLEERIKRAMNVLLSQAPDKRKEIIEELSRRDAEL